MNVRIFSWVVITAASASFHAVAEPTVDFNNRRTFSTPADRKVYRDFMGGTPLVGTNHFARLLVGVDSSNLRPVGNPAPFRDVPVTDSLAGTWVAGTRTLTGYSEGQSVVLAVQVWDATGGATYETSSFRAQSCPFAYTIPLPGSAPQAFYIENFRGIPGPLTCPPGPVAIANRSGQIEVSFIAGTLEVSSDLSSWTPVSGVTSSPFVDPGASALTHRFYRTSQNGLVSQDCVGFHRLHIGAGWSLIANHLRPTDARVPALIPSPPSGTAVFPFRPRTGGYSSISYLGGSWEGDDLDMTLGPGEGVWINPPSAFDQIFVGEVVLRSTNDLGAGFSLVSSVRPFSQPLSALNFPVAEGDEIYQFNRMTGGYIGNTYLGGAWEGDNDGAEPMPRVGESFWVRKRAPASWVQSLPSP